MITHKSYRLLIVDDEKNLCRMLQTAFSIDGHETRVAEDGEAALISFVQDKPDVVLMDNSDDRLCRCGNRSGRAASRGV
ncbi:acetoacetate metabolism regulatory protein AtoC [Morganella morganii]|nr:acetoacetate metabolism regulatory protein AtoC [Morganella morganii]